MPVVAPPWTVALYALWLVPIGLFARWLYLRSDRLEASLWRVGLRLIVIFAVFLIVIELLLDSASSARAQSDTPASAEPPHRPRPTGALRGGLFGLAAHGGLGEKTVLRTFLRRQLTD
ncbi:MAG: hypothetical protein R3304_08005 [Longimicrobiales bacterium]|nr:hypothetical protein [Longimicrobiales bacterium]